MAGAITYLLMQGGVIMITKNPIWDEVKEKQNELKLLLEENWRKGEYHIAAIGEVIVRTIDESIATSENTLKVTQHFQQSISDLESLIQKQCQK